MKKYTVITGDIVRSRGIVDRGNIQKKLKLMLQKINKKYEKIISVKFSLTLGDEFQGLIKELVKSYEVIKNIEKEMYPLRIRFGVGYGKISTPFSQRIGEMDGECFINSREALELSRKMNQNIAYKTGFEEKDLAINTILMLISAIKESWKDIHYRRVWLYEKLETYKKVAQKEKVSVQMISKMFKNIKYDKVKKAEENLIELLNQLHEVDFLNSTVYG